MYGISTKRKEIQMVEKSKNFGPPYRIKINGEIVTIGSEKNDDDLLDVLHDLAIVMGEEVRDKFWLELEKMKNELIEEE